MSHDLIAFVQRTKASARLWHPFALAAVFVLLTGCATVEKYSLTHRLWDNEDMRKWSEPAPNPNLALFEATNGVDVLVQYDALSERHSTVSRRAYFLHSNQARIEAGAKPEWIGPRVADGLKTIPVMSAPEALTNQPHGMPAYAVLIKEGRGFVLFRPPEAEATYDFPVYPETCGTPTRIALTPFAVAGDTVMVGLVSAVVGFLLWVQMGGPGCY